MQLFRVFAKKDYSIKHLSGKFGSPGTVFGSRQTIQLFLRFEEQVDSGTKRS
jgi:hypothetical protein